MTSHCRTRVASSFLYVLLGVAMLPLFAGAASAQIQVTSANPPAAAQGTMNLNVTVTGKGFKKGAQAQWFVTGTTSPGGVTVNSTAFVSSTQLTANITVSDTAVIANFDILVANSDGRIGKGTELFSVTANGSATGSSLTQARVTMNDSFSGTPNLTSDGNAYSHPSLGPIYLDYRLANPDPCVTATVNDTGLFMFYAAWRQDLGDACNDSITAGQRRTFFIRFSDSGVCDLFGLLADFQLNGSCTLKTETSPRIRADDLFSQSKTETAVEVMFRLANVSYTLQTDAPVPIVVLDTATRQLTYMGTATLKTISSAPQRPQTIARNLSLVFEITAQRALP
jgi:hypothetical protein